MKVLRWKSFCKTIGITALLFSMSYTQINAEEFMQVKDIKTGMQGIAKTVVEGDTISTFDVKVLGIMENKGPSGDLILAEFSGPVIDKSGGIAHGMSGSPVYIDGKLVGAVAYGWGFSRSHIGMITPIDQMVKLWDEPYTKNIPNPWNKDRKLIPIGTPLMAYGFDSSAAEFIQDKLKDYDIKVYDTASSTGDDEEQPLLPGSSVAATLIDGDLKLGAIGTVTYVDKDKIVAFGHPYMKEGETGYFMHNSRIFTVINSVESSFKLGSIGKNIGAITEDRGAGIAGTIGLTPKYVPLSIKTTDLDRNVNKDSHVRVISDDSLTPSLITSSIYNFLKKTIDRNGGGTAKITYTIRPLDSKLKPYTRSDMFYSSTNVAYKSIDKLYDIVDRLLNNSFVDYSIENVDVSVDVTKDRKTAQIIDATASPIIVSPGDSIRVSVNLHPFRGEDFTKMLTFKVPEKQPLGEMKLEVRGGGVTPLPYLIEKQKLNLTDEVIRRLHVYKTFDEYFKRLKNMDTNNSIVVEILENNVSMVDDGDEEVEKAKLTNLGNRPTEGPKKFKTNSDSEQWDAFDGDEDRAVLNTDYVVLGDGQFNITVVAPEKKEKALSELIAKRKKEAAEKAEKKKNGKKSLVEIINEAGQEALDQYDKDKEKKDDKDKDGKEDRKPSTDA